MASNRQYSRRTRSWNSVERPPIVDSQSDSEEQVGDATLSAPEQAATNPRASDTPAAARDSNPGISTDRTEGMEIKQEQTTSTLSRKRRRVRESDGGTSMAKRGQDLVSTAASKPTTPRDTVEHSVGDDVDAADAPGIPRNFTEDSHTALLLREAGTNTEELAGKLGKRMCEAKPATVEHHSARTRMHGYQAPSLLLSDASRKLDNQQPLDTAAAASASAPAAETGVSGHMISTHGIKCDPKNIAAICNWKRPETVKQLRNFLGTVNFYRRLIKDYARIAKPLYTASKRRNRTLLWDAECNKAFYTLRNALACDPIMAHPSRTGTTILDIDVSDYAVGGVLSQRQVTCDGNEVENVIAYASQTFDGCEQHACIYRRELLAFVALLEHFRIYLHGHECFLRSDHVHLKHVKHRRNLEGQCARLVERSETGTCYERAKRFEHDIDVPTYTAKPPAKVATHNEPTPIWTAGLVTKADAETSVPVTVPNVETNQSESLADALASIRNKLTRLDKSAKYGADKSRGRQFSNENAECLPDKQDDDQASSRKTSNIAKQE